MPQKRILKRPQVNVVLSGPQMSDVQQIMDDRGIVHLSDYVRQLMARDIRQWKTEHYAQFADAKQQNTPEFQAFLKWKKSQAKMDEG